MSPRQTGTASSMAWNVSASTAWMPYELLYAIWPVERSASWFEGVSSLWCKLKYHTAGETHRSTDTVSQGR